VGLTNNHCGELEALSNTFPMDLVWEVGKAHIAHQLFANDTGNASCMSGVDERRAGAIKTAI